MGELENYKTVQYPFCKVKEYFTLSIIPPPLSALASSTITTGDSNGEADFPSRKLLQSYDFQYLNEP